MRRPGRLKLAGLWIGLHPALGLLPAAALCIGLVACELPIGPPERLTGAVERIDYIVKRSSARVVVSVRLRDGALVRTRLDGAYACEAGDLIRLQRQRRILGRTYTADFGPCIGRSGRPRADLHQPPVRVKAPLSAGPA